LFSARCDKRKPLDERFEARILEREAKILEGNIAIGRPPEREEDC
jgi:hypothetical protein